MTSLSNSWRPIHPRNSLLIFGKWWFALRSLILTLFWDLSVLGTPKKLTFRTKKLRCLSGCPVWAVGASIPQSPASLSQDLAWSARPTKKHWGAQNTVGESSFLREMATSTFQRLGGGFNYIICFIFTPIWGRFPIWLICFRWVETTNQVTMSFVFLMLCYLQFMFDV